MNNKQNVQMVEMYLKPKTVCVRLNMSYSTIYSYIKNGVLDSIQTPTGKFLIASKSLEKFCSTNRN